MAQSQIGLRASAARQVLGIPTAPCGGLFPLTPALSLGERVNPALRGEQSRHVGFPLRDARCSLSLRERVRVRKHGANYDPAYRTPPRTVELSDTSRRAKGFSKRLSTNPIGTACSLWFSPSRFHKNFSLLSQVGFGNKGR